MPSTVVVSRAARAMKVLMLAVAVLCAAAVPAMAVEDGGAQPTEHGPAPSIDEIGTQNDVSQEFLPEPAQEPPFMRFLYVPMIIAGVVIVGLLLMLYLAWQPRFAEERRRKRR